MRCHIPQISWHNRDPVLSVDFQPGQKGVRRLATSGTDTHVLIWLLTETRDGAGIDLECVADLNRHSKTVNVVRFSPSGEILASADDEAAIILWRNQPRIEGDIFADDDAVVNKENWTALKVLRGHIDDICDLSWSPDSQFMVTGSVDNTAILWDVRKGKNLGLLSDHKGFVQGVSWDPLGQYIATLSSDRSLRIYNITTRKVLHRVQRALLPNNSQNSNNKEAPETAPKATRIFYDDTLKSFSRRLSFSPCGNLLIAPTGIIEENEGKFNNATYMFTRCSLNKPVLCLPTADKFTLAVRCCPVLFKFRDAPKNKGTSPDENVAADASEPASLFNLPYRVVFAVATQDSILFYDTQQVLPFARVSNIHYTRLCDLSWSSDGKLLMASSTDGYCSFVIFADGELGTPYVEETPKQESKESEEIASPDELRLILEADTNECSDCDQPIQSSPMQQDDKMVEALTEELHETQINKSPSDCSVKDKMPNQEKNNSGASEGNVALPSAPKETSSDPKKEKAPRRIQFVTLSSTLKKE